MKVVFFAARAFASAGENSVNIFITDVFGPSIRSLTYGMLCAVYRIGVIAAPYLGQVYLHRVSDLGAVLIFSGIAFLGTLISLLLPLEQMSMSTREMSTSRPGHRKQIFRNIFKPRSPVSAEVAAAVAAGESVCSP
ncbi:unnamed protein product [Protopolystoma xenopodis]|uniref:Major facilitator superfamily (MFS) profile domain-containing protein n=1 Tax=Protopolystoma xenopodis TaxID=117903 RepID=A0A3S5AML7_9PLAT|nr:unnamed protein product [Protopolystoma xenopodis]